MDHSKAFLWKIDLNLRKNCFDHKDIYNILENITKYIPTLDDYDTYNEDDINNYVLRSSGNAAARFELSSDSISYIFYHSENDDEWLDYPNVIFDIIESSDIINPLSINYIERCSANIFRTKINHGRIIKDLFIRNSEFSKLMESNPIMNFTPDFSVLLDKKLSIYNRINFKSDSSLRDDMNETYANSKELTVWFSIIKKIGFNPQFNISECFRLFDAYYSKESDNFKRNIENPIYRYLKEYDN
ncbi:hypothetical protein [Leadbettera azotonutricia]|uniref:Uncharacterized protein n=1 Tax=Leadbettera azotonutricia (strain ATCC BAA-888 / DSM 13862 / ZAS-9) TaxID=545695 RepID=F5YEG7_LEAAZ|nr:hypothetical protein [Leadbettera azotonutricia]AEF83275.1 hypothetical protein TREAZ_2602 [Leadbettera azotonutricia ZAS-9]